MQIFSDFSEWCQVYFINCHDGKGKEGALVHIHPGQQISSQISTRKLGLYNIASFIYSTFSNMIMALQYCRLPTSTTTLMKLERVITMELCHTNTTSAQ